MDVRPRVHGSHREQDQWRFRFARDSALEGGGFELPVPDQKVAASGERQRGQALLNVPYAAGTGSSNLLCSSSQSVSAVNPEAIGQKPRTLAAVCGWRGT